VVFCNLGVEKPLVTTAVQNDDGPRSSERQIMVGSNRVNRPRDRTSTLHLPSKGWERYLRKYYKYALRGGARKLMPRLSS
jgi:hypothetical protein